MSTNIAIEARTDSHSHEKPARWPANIGLVGLGGFVLASIPLHWLQPELDPLDEVMSYYVHGTGGWLLTIGLLCLGMGSLALTAGIWHVVEGPGARAGRWMMAVWSAGVILGGIFPADPPGNWDQPLSITGMIHGNAALIAIFSLPAAALMLVRSFRRDVRWVRRAALLSGLAMMTLLGLSAFIASLVPAIISPGPPVLLGLTERILLGVYVIWLGVVAIGLLRVDE